jgi:carboxylesterase
MRPPPQAFDPALTAPFDVGQGPPCLLLHGFTGTPWELRPLGEALAARGFRAVGIRLPGHGQNAEAMLQGSVHHWRSAAERALDALGADVRVVGLSMGALLALDLAARFPDRVRRLALLAPAFALQDPLATALKRVRRLPLLALRPWIEKHSVDLADPVARAGAPVIPAFPSRLLNDFWMLQDLAQAALTQVQAPTLIATGARDQVVDPAAIRRAAQVLARHVPLREIEQREAAHLLPRDHGHAVLEEEIARHFAP